MMKERLINTSWKTTRKETISYAHFIHLLFKVFRRNPNPAPLLLSLVTGNGLIDMSSNLEWADVEQRVKNVQKGKQNEVVLYASK
jgi:hypothetical protein